MHLLLSGVSLEIIRDFLGHVDVKTTQIYARANLEMKLRALEKVAGESPSASLPSWQQNKSLLDCQCQLEPVQRGAVVLGLLFVLAGDSLPRRIDALALGRFIGSFQDGLHFSIVATQRSQLLRHGFQRGPRLRHLTGLGRQQCKPCDARTRNFGAMLGPGQ